MDRSVGIRIELPFEENVNPFVQSAFEHKAFFARLHHFVLTSDTFVVVPGGIGTVLEAVMVWQLQQLRHVNDVPLVSAGEMWPEMIDWAKQHMLSDRSELASPADFDIPVCVQRVDEVIDVIGEHHRTWLAGQASWIRPMRREYSRESVRRFPVLRR